MQTLKKTSIPFDIFSQKDLIYVSSLPGQAQEHLLTICQKAQESSTPVVTNPGGGQLKGDISILKQSLPLIDTFIINSLEARVFMAKLIEDDLCSYRYIVLEKPGKSGKRQSTTAH